MASMAIALPSQATILICIMHMMPQSIEKMIAETSFEQIIQSQHGW
jgi:hypothetical protein